MKTIADTVIDDDGVTMIRVFVDVGWGLREVHVSLPTTLRAIYERYKHVDMIYVVADGMLSGTIYRCGNYGKGEWQKYATTQGMV